MEQALCEGEQFRLAGNAESIVRSVHHDTQNLRLKTKRQGIGVFSGDHDFAFQLLKRQEGFGRNAIKARGADVLDFGLGPFLLSWPMEMSDAVELQARILSTLPRRRGPLALALIRSFLPVSRGTEVELPSHAPFTIRMSTWIGRN